MAEQRLSGVWAAVERPTLVLDVGRARRNIERMAGKAAAAGVRFRPHFKTHQSAEVGEWFRACGVESITVSSVAMARYFADHGWRDITIAFPANVREMTHIDTLAGEVKLHLLVDSVAAVERLEGGLGHRVGVWIEIDTGYMRSGTAWDDVERLAALAAALAQSERLALRGVLTHAGHTYKARAAETVQAVYTETAARLAAARATLEAAGPFEGLEISTGDTPGCSVVEDLGDVDEVRPGNFVFYDLTQLEIGACAEQDIAVAVACPVVGVYPGRREIVLYGGAVHLSKDWLELADGSPSFGRAAMPIEGGWGPLLPGVHLRSVSQEHGIVYADVTAWPGELAELRVGDVLAVLPIHSCLTADLLHSYHTLEGEVLKMADLR